MTLSSFLKDIFSRYIYNSILAVIPIIDFILEFAGPYHFWWEVNIYSSCLLFVMCLLSFAFKLLSSFLTFSSLTVTRFGVIFYHLLCLDFAELFGYVGCCFMLNLEKLWALFLHMSPRFSILSFFLLRFQLHIYENAWYCPLSHWGSAFVVILFSLFFSLDNFFWPVFKFTDPLVFIVQIAAKGIWWLPQNFKYRTY